MKIKGAKYEVMKSAMLAIIERYGRKAIAKHFEGRSDTWVFWALWSQASFDLRNSDTHPAFGKGRVRTVPHNADFNIYSDGVNDNHIETALKKICNEAGIGALHRLSLVT